MANFNANVSGLKRRVPKRDLNDQYETPDNVVRVLTSFVRFEGSILEPACGSGRMARALRAEGYKVIASDIQRGKDFLTRRSAADNVVTNPPYRDRLPEAFLSKALELTPRGKVALLLSSSWLWSNDRVPLFTGDMKPSDIIVIPWRIFFYQRNGRPIPGQARNHAWVIWDTSLRGKKYKTSWHNAGLEEQYGYKGE